MFVKALLVGIYNRSSDIEEDLYYTALMNKIEVETTERVPTAAAVLEQLKPKVIVNIEGLREIFSSLDEKQMITLYRAVVKHELMHIYLGHLLLPDKITMDGNQLREKLRRPIVLPDKIEIDTRTEIFRKVFNIAADSIINNMIKEFKELQNQKLVHLIPAEQFLSIEVTRIPAFYCGTNLMENCSAEELAVVLYYMLQNSLQSSDSQSTNQQGGAGQQSQSGQQSESGQNQVKIPQDIIGEDIGYTSEEIRDIAEQVWKDIVEKTSEISNRGLDKISAELKKKLERKGRINWKQQLKAEIWGDISDQIMVSKHRLSKRTCLPPKIVKRPSPVVLAFVDTSGSVSDELLARFLNELSKLKSDTNAQIKAVMYSINATMQKIKKPTDIVTITERGGTDLESAMKQIPAKEFAMIDSLIIFTDGYDNFPAEQMAKISAKKIFVLPENHDSNFEHQAKKYGKVILIEE